jgi:perosamine synthetase
MNNKIIRFATPLINFKEKNEVLKVLNSGIYSQGKKCKKFEEDFKKYTKAKFATSVNSCTSGMHLFYYSLGIGKGDEVIVPAQTHTATAHAVELTGAKPVFIDCNLEDGNIDIRKIEKKINKKTKAICVVHFLGFPVELDKLKNITRKHKIYLLEDCALSLGAKYKNIHTGLWGDAGVFSFYPTKQITSGEGGMIITNNKKIYEKVKIQKSLGVKQSFLERKIPGIYDTIDVGFNYRMSEIHAAIGIEQLKKFPLFLKIRKKNFLYLRNEIKKLNDLKILYSSRKNSTNAYYCLNILLKNKTFKQRNNLILELKKNNIIVTVNYPQPVPRMEYYKKKYKYNKREFYNAETISDKSISLPLGPHLKKNDLRIILDNLKKFLHKI